MPSLSIRFVEPPPGVSASFFALETQGASGIERGGREMRRGVEAVMRGEWAVMRFVAAAGSCRW